MLLNKANRYPTFEANRWNRAHWILRPIHKTREKIIICIRFCRTISDHHLPNVSFSAICVFFFSLFSLVRAVRWSCCCSVINTTATSCQHDLCTLINFCFNGKHSYDCVKRARSARISQCISYPVQISFHRLLAAPAARRSTTILQQPIATKKTQTKITHFRFALFLVARVAAQCMHLLRSANRLIYIYANWAWPECGYRDGVPCVSRHRPSHHWQTSTYYYYFIGIFSMGNRANAIHTITTCGYFVIRIYPFHLLCATRTNEPKPHSHTFASAHLQAKRRKNTENRSQQKLATKHAKRSNTFSIMCGTWTDWN